MTGDAGIIGKRCKPSRHLKFFRTIATFVMFIRNQIVDTQVDNYAVQNIVMFIKTSYYVLFFWTGFAIIVV